MVTDTTAAFFSSYAHDFASIYGNDHNALNRLANGVLRKSMLLRYEKTLAGCTPTDGRRIIDIGCGPGHYSVALASRGAAKVVGVDFAPGMILLAEERAHSRMIEFRIGERVTFQPPDRPALVGMLTRYNRKSVTVVTDDGERWNVSPSVLRRLEPTAVTDPLVLPLRKAGTR